MMRRTGCLALLAVLVILQLQVDSATAALKVGYYSATACKNVEAIVRYEVRKKFQADPSIAGQLIRIYFHDCFADHQCDASLLLKKNKDVALKPEISSGGNEGIRGLDFIDYLKRKVVAACVGQANLVSCADIIALAARDAVVLTAPNRRPYAIPTGRLDGKVSNVSKANMLPSSKQRIPDVLASFSRAGFSAEETLILSGAHTLGQSRCKFFDDRLYNWRNTNRPDPTLNQTTLAFLRKTCTNSAASKEARVFLDQNTTSSFLTDKSYFRMLTQRMGVLETDQKLLTDPATRQFVQPLAAGTESNFMTKFEAAMIKMGNLGSASVLGSKGEIRKVCSVLNS